MKTAGMIVVGAGGHARACIEVIERQGRYRIAGLVGSADELHTRHLGYEVIGDDEDLPALAASYQYALIALGQIATPEHRIWLYQRALQLGFEFPVVIAPSAHVSPHASIGAGSIVMHGAIVNANARVGNNCIVNTRAVIEHDAAVGDDCHISTGSILNGNVQVGAGSFVGSGCVIKQGVTLGTRCVIGMGLSVRHDQADYSKFLG
jgi:sugar O-acyltransferase (sialic acid O-acetyltransferase NeuD family)